MSKSDCQLSTSPVSVDAPDFKMSAYLASVNDNSNFEPSICPMLINEPVYDLFSCRISVTELSASASVNEPDFELSSCPVPVSELAYELSACSVVTRENID